MNVVVLSSGNLGVEVLEQIFPEINIIGIATDSHSARIKSLAGEKAIPLFVGNPRRGKLKLFLDKIDVQIDIILSINYIFLIEKDIINYPKYYCINIHGSLLPKYRGRTPHVWAIINNEKYAGVTVHVIDEGCDTGPILRQKKISIGANTTGGELLHRYNKLYPSIILETLQKIVDGKAKPKKQVEDKATYFGRRTPDDGEINWNWQKERIRNWVRAQATPYPGAFTFLGREKIIIHEVSYSDRGFSYEMANGFVVATDPSPLIKVPNGVLTLTDLRSPVDLIKLEKKILGR